MAKIKIELETEVARRILSLAADSLMRLQRHDKGNFPLIDQKTLTTIRNLQADNWELI